MQRKNIFFSILALTALINSSNSFALSDREKLAISGLAGLVVGKALIRPTTQALHENAGLSVKKSVGATFVLSTIGTAAVDYVAEGECNIANIAINLVGQAISAIWTLNENPIKEVREAKTTVVVPELSRRLYTGRDAQPNY